MLHRACRSPDIYQSYERQNRSSGTAPLLVLTIAIEFLLAIGIIVAGRFNLVGL